MGGYLKKKKKRSAAASKHCHWTPGHEEGVGSERQGEVKKWGRKEGSAVVTGGGGESAASRVIYLPNQDTMSRL